MYLYLCFFSLIQSMRIKQLKLPHVRQFRDKLVNYHLFLNP